MRESGYYWTKWFASSSWTICKYNSQFHTWSCIGFEEDYIDEDFYEIDKQQIIKEDV